MKLIKIILINIAFISFCHAQKLDLFQDIETQETDNTNRVPRNQQNKNTATTPLFTVKGISRFGDRYLVSLITNNGSSEIIPWLSKTSVSLRGYPGYSIADVSSKTVTLVYPEASGCSPIPDKGINCNGPYMLLSLTNGEPIKQNNVVENNSNIDFTNQEEENIDIIDGEEGRFFRNPFSGEMQEIPELSPEELARRDERRGRRAEMFRDFEIVRIPDEDIPEGMQRIRTPFGDSLEPVESE
jgi:hypothetical protein